MRMMIIAAALIGGFVATNANAMPIAPVKVDTQVIKADYACGPGWRLTRWGECRPRWNRPPPPRYSWHRPPPRWAWDGPRWRHREWDRRDRYRY